MIEILIFHIHIVAALYAYTKRWQEAGIKEGIMAVLLMGLVFVIGWSLTSPVANLILPNAWRTNWFSSDTLGLLLLMIPEIIFFKVFFLKDEQSEANA